LIEDSRDIFLVPDIVSYYYARDSLPKLWRMYYQYGYFKPLVVLKLGIPFTPTSLLSVFLSPLSHLALAFYSHFVGGSKPNKPNNSQANSHFVSGSWQWESEGQNISILTWRQLVPAAFVGSLGLSRIFALFFRPALWVFLFILGSYALANLSVSASLAAKRGWKYFLVLPVVFATLHFGYGIGYLKGIWDFVIRKRHLSQKFSDLPLTR